MPGERARFRRHAFLQTTITRQTKNMLIENAMLAGVEMRLRHFRCHRHTNRVANTLPERTGRAFDSRRSQNIPDVPASSNAADENA